MKNVILILITLCAFISGCSSIPQAAIDVNKEVSKGIESLGENGLEMINAWEQSAYNMLDERWSKIYEKADSTYRSQKGIAAGASLSPKQMEDVAGLSSLVRDEVREKIRSEANLMRDTIKSNMKNILDANESITNILVSANGVAKFQQTAIKKVGELVPIPPAISTFITDSLQTAGL
ncbi:hypothetical protein [Pseudoalteromonas sp. R3]|uniref:hypothetical protein n=1 Tax=Pseudoalteromonas sp. R3 TaxID=1709477 RepID=UPI0006B45CD1|nr:hypothetical protein [Pseudoalteromonas sp. R3]AZZ98464.1 hypothetical protein ELR70_15905 [Pseudoalteromonas sp. R3]